MRFERLLLNAFGPFTEQQLDLSGGAPGGLHVIYGPNEAGKSTSLRAVTGFLFGIPHVTPDAHLHPSNRLSVGAVVSDGEQSYELVRLKRRKDALVGPDGEPVVRDPLPQLLSHLDERSFSSRFGLDQDDLERGAEALLGGSEQGLFAAGTAGSEVRQVLEFLESRAGQLYRARGSKPLLNRALSDYEQAAREARRAERPPEKWLEQRRAYEEAKALVSELRSRRNEARTELRQLNRLRGLMSDLTAWEEGRERREQLGDEPSLPENARQIREESERTLSETGVEARHLERELSNFEEKLAELPPESRLAEVDDEQLQLSARAGTAISARKDLPKREASLLEQVRQMRALLSDLGRDAQAGQELEQARSLMPSARTAALVRTLLAEHGALVTAAEAADKGVRAAERELSRLEEAGVAEPSLPLDLASLEAAHADALAEQGLARAIAEDENELSRLEAEVSRLRIQLGQVVPWRQLAAWLPSSAQVATAVGRYREQRMRLTETQQALDTQEQEAARLRTQLSRSGGSELPTEDRLASVRADRDAQLDALETQPCKVGFGELRGTIRTSDDLSDRLRSEADRIAQAASIAREIEAAEQTQERLSRKLEEVQVQLSSSKESHRSLCEKLGLASPGDPEDAVPLFDALHALVRTESEHEQLAAALSSKEERLEGHLSRLKRLIEPKIDDAGLPAHLAAAARLLRSGVQAQERTKQRGEAMARAHAALEEAVGERVRESEALQVWEDRWEDAVTPLGLRRESSISVAQDVLTTFEKMGRVLQEADNLERRISGMERDTESLADDVRAVLKRHLPQLVEMDPVDAAVQLQEAIRAARRVRDERSHYRQLVEDRRTSLAKVEARRATAEARRQGLMQAAKLSDAAELPTAEERQKEIRILEAKLEALERSIREKADGASLEELRAESNPWKGQAAKLNHRIYELEELSEELEEEFREAETRMEGIQKGLEIYRSEEVVEARQLASTRGAEARVLLREYLVTRAAQRLLKQQMESYAERFAGPIAGRAGELFERMTLGRYTKLSIGLGEKTLRCVRDGQELEIGQLSRGTRAQLYFALRLASLEAYFEEQPAVPLVFDDLFVDFDDDRTTAAFEILAEVAQKVQVLYFTHLARDVEAAADAVSPKLLFEHRLGVS